MAPVPGPIYTAHLFEELDALLLDLLTSLHEAEWKRPTIVPRWNVHQVAAHLLDTALRRLSMCRDAWRVDAGPVTSERELSDLVNQLNARGVEVYGRLSPQLLIELTGTTVRQLSAHLMTLDPLAPACFAVSWAREGSSDNWFDIAREFTERWHHQQQIRMALGRPDILTPRLYAPVLATFMRALPRAYENIDAPEATVCQIVVPGGAGGTWQIERRAEQWHLAPPSFAAPDATAIVPPEVAWRLFTKGLSATEARASVAIVGDAQVGAGVFNARAVVG